MQKDYEVQAVACAEMWQAAVASLVGSACGNNTTALLQRCRLFTVGAEVARSQRPCPGTSGRQQR
jgi:hypothetical protein